MVTRSTTPWNPWESEMATGREHSAAPAVDQVIDQGAQSAAATGLG